MKNFQKSLFQIHQSLVVKKQREFQKQEALRIEEEKKRQIEDFKKISLIKIARHLKMEKILDDAEKLKKQNLLKSWVVKIALPKIAQKFNKIYKKFRLEEDIRKKQEQIKAEEEARFKKKIDKILSNVAEFVYRIYKK